MRQAITWSDNDQVHDGVIGQQLIIFFFQQLG